MDTRPFADLHLSRLMLGTVQLGLSYGIANRTGQPSYEQARAIVACAYEGGVNCFDTAAIYGVSEEVLGRALVDLGIAGRVTVVSKVAPLAEDLPPADAMAPVERSLVETLKRLRLDVLPILLLHREENWRYVEALLRLRERGLVQHIGASVMTPSATSAILATGQAEALQIPTNVLDQRFTRGGILQEAARRGAAVFVRSIYLQGLLLLPEGEVLPELAEVIPIRRRLRALAAESGMELAELAVRYVLGLEGVTCTLVGVETVEQMRANLQLFARGPLPADLIRAIQEAVPDLPERIVMPNQWSKRMADVKPQR